MGALGTLLAEILIIKPTKKIYAIIQTILHLSLLTLFIIGTFATIEDGIWYIFLLMSIFPIIRSINNIRRIIKNDFAILNSPKEKTLPNSSNIDKIETATRTAEDNKALEVFNSFNLSEGQIFYAKTHQDFINKVNIKKDALCKGSLIQLTDNMILWMVRLDNHDRAGWKNVENTETGEIIEENIYHSLKWNGIDSWYNCLFNSPYRILAEITENENRQYKIRGVYKLNTEKSEPYGLHYFNKI